MASLFFALSKAGNVGDFRLKTQLREIIEIIVCLKKDVYGVLPTGIGKSLVLHLLKPAAHVKERAEQNSSRGS